MHITCKERKRKAIGAKGDYETEAQAHYKGAATEDVNELKKQILLRHVQRKQL